MVVAVILLAVLVVAVALGPLAVVIAVGATFIGGTLGALLVIAWWLIYHGIANIVRARRPQSTGSQCTPMPL